WCRRSRRRWSRGTAGSPPGGSTPSSASWSPRTRTPCAAASSPASCSRPRPAPVRRGSSSSPAGSSSTATAASSNAASVRTSPSRARRSSSGYGSGRSASAETRATRPAGSPRCAAAPRPRIVRTMSTTGDHGSWNPYGNDGGDHGTSGQAPQDPWAQQPAPHDPYAQPSAGSASDPYAQGQQSWSPAAGSGAPASDPYGAPAGGPSPYGQSAYAQPAGGPAPQGQAQSRLVVGLLGIFLGGFGVHRFLLGYTKIGLIQVLVSVLSCFILYPLIQIWGLIEGIMVLAKSPTFE